MYIDYNLHKQVTKGQVTTFNKTSDVYTIDDWSDREHPVCNALTIVTMYTVVELSDLTLSSIHPFKADKPSLIKSLDFKHRFKFL